MAITKCAQTLIVSMEMGKRIRICFDRRAALGALSAPTFRSQLVWECKCTLNHLTVNNNVALVLVPEHSGIKGNEIADQLTKTGSATKLMGSEPALAVSSCLDKAKIRA